MRSRCSRVLKFTIFVCVSVFVLVSVGACDSESAQERAKIITPEEFRTLQGARAQLGQVIEDLSKAIDPVVSQPERRAKVAAVVKKYQKEMPEPNKTYKSPTTQPEDFETQFKGTVTGDLVQMDTSVSWKGDEGTSIDAVSAWYVANDYVQVINSMYGLEDFEDYIVRHTLNGGARINPSDPPDNMAANQSMVFGGSSFPGMGAVNINIVYGPDGNIKYAVGLQELGGEYRAATVPDIEARFVLNASEALRGGDSLLLDRTRL